MRGDNSPVVPRFSVFTKRDAIWGNRMLQNNSLRESRHLLDAQHIRATEDRAQDRNIFKQETAIKVTEEMEMQDPLDKVRAFLES